MSSKASPGAPRASVIIRSYNRIGALCELIEAIQRQSEQDFEIVVVEQSTRVLPADAARLEQLARDPRVRLLRHPPLGGPRARNVGARAARADLLVFMDDDDLPADELWLANHLANFADPRCLAVTGRHFVDGDLRPPYRDLERARRQVLSFVPVLMWQRAYTRSDRRRRVENVTGGNASIRREVLARVGLWDECTTIEDELSFCYRLRAALRPGEYLVFDPEALMRRRLHLDGGMDKRSLHPVRFAARAFEFLHHIVAHYFPVRFVLLYPAYVALCYVVCVDWIWNEQHGRGGSVQRLAAAAGLLAALPALWSYWLARHALRRVTRGPLEHAPRLELQPEGGAS
jgi:glycosyltransferase involved in cell wall biosynthesis